MKKILAILFCLFSLPAIAADNALIVTVGSGLTMRSIDIGGGVQSSGVNLVGSTGASILGTAGTANAAVLSVQGIGSGTTLGVTEVNSAAILTAIGNPIPPASSTTSVLTGVSCGSAVSSCVLKSSAGNLFGVYANCTSACWLMVFNATSAPSNGATTAGTGSGNLVECIGIDANKQGGLNYPTFPVRYSVGITAAISSTACATLTLSTVGFVRGTVL